MPTTPEVPQQPTATPQLPSSPTPHSGTPTSGSESVPTDLIAPEYRYPSNENIPQWARGKSAAEILSLTQELIDSGTRGANQIPQAPPASLPSDEEYITGGQLRQHVNAAQQQAMSQVSPYLKTVADQQAIMSYNLAKRDHAETFKKYEPEILTVLNRVPREHWTLDVLDNAVKYVKGCHVDEITADRLRALESTVESTMRSTGRAGSTPTSPRQETAEETLGKLPKEWRDHAQAVGITSETLFRFCMANDITMDEFFQQFGKGLVTDAVADVNFVRSR